ncbi:MAG: hydrogenase iron-sulfur subunit [Kiritimatiellae bacterium]|nr:hydrogenase iron-sulfur subunit [Kiritimatiellia bacterium]
MALNEKPDVTIYVCRNSFPQEGRLPRQWEQDGVRVRVKEIPCSGKLDVQYVFHAIEGGSSGICVVTCPEGECRLAEGNYRSEIRIRTVRRLLEEIGLEPERAELLRSSPKDTPEQFVRTIREVVGRFAALGRSAVCASA